MPCFVAAFAKPSPKSIRCEWPSLRRQQERHVTNGRSVDDSLESWKDRELECDRLSAAVLLLSEAQPPISDVLTTQGHHVAPPVRQTQGWGPLLHCSDG